jgi:hypothetical protein
MKRLKTLAAALTFVGISCAHGAEDAPQMTEYKPRPECPCPAEFVFEPDWRVKGPIVKECEVIADFLSRLPIYGMDADNPYITDGNPNDVIVVQTAENGARDILLGLVPQVVDAALEWTKTAPDEAIISDDMVSTRQHQIAQTRLLLEWAKQEALKHGSRGGIYDSGWWDYCMEIVHELHMCLSPGPNSGIELYEHEEHVRPARTMWDMYNWHYEDISHMLYENTSALKLTAQLYRKALEGGWSLAHHTAAEAEGQLPNPLRVWLWRPPGTDLHLFDTDYPRSDLTKVMMQYPRTYQWMVEIAQQPQAFPQELSQMCLKAAGRLCRGRLDGLFVGLMRDINKIARVALSLWRSDVNDEERQRFFAHSLMHWTHHIYSILGNIFPGEVEDDRGFIEGLQEHFGTVDLQ